MDMARLTTLELKKVDSVGTLKSLDKEFPRNSTVDVVSLRMSTVDVLQSDPITAMMNTMTDNWVRSLMIQHPRKGRSGLRLNSAQVRGLTQELLIQSKAMRIL